MGAKDIAVGAMETLKANVQTGMADRGKNATGGTSRRIAVLALGNDATGEASLEADSQWKFVGNGRGPGGRPPISNLRQWIEARGLNLNVYALANKIALKGSADFRLKRTNIFLDEIRAWEERDVPQAEGKLADEVTQRTLALIDSVKFT